MQLKIADENGKTYEYIIQLRHVRNLNKTKDFPGINPYGGVTILSAISKRPLPRIYYSRCHENDHYNKRTGLLYCLHELIWDLIDKNCAILTKHTVNGGKGIEVLIGYSNDPVGDMSFFIAPPKGLIPLKDN